MNSPRIESFQWFLKTALATERIIFCERPWWEIEPGNHFFSSLTFCWGHFCLLRRRKLLLTTCVWLAIAKHNKYSNTFSRLELVEMDKMVLTLEIVGCPAWMQRSWIYTVRYQKLYFSDNLFQNYSLSIKYLCFAAI